jgi:two-component system phosphate regulon sensor histidine kinase PhoR
MLHPKVLSLLTALAVALVVTAVLLVVDRIAFASHLLVFLGVGAATYFLFYYIIDHQVLRPLRQLKKRLLSLQVGVPEDEADISASINAIETALALRLAQMQNELERMRKLEAFRRDFIADVSHELKTPIFSAQGFVHTLLDGAAKDKKIRKKFLKKAAKSLDGLDVLVQDLLTLSHIETGQVRMHFSEYDVFSLTREVLDELRDRADEKGVRLRMESPATKVKVWADKLRIRQVLVNLVSNAINHSLEDGEVVVSFQPGNDVVTIAVQDFGKGIPEEHIHRIFERFYRIDKSRSREKGGTGLGLAIVKHILDGHHSTMTVESKPGKGAIFTFALPTGQDQAATDGKDNISKEEQRD